MTFVIFNNINKMNIENELILASEAYSNDIAQRALISNIPFIGSSIDNIFTGKASKYYSERIEIFIQCVNEEFDSMEENKVDKAFLQSSEFYDLITSLIENSVKTRHIERVKLFSKLLKSQVLSDSSSKYLSDDFTYLINELVPRDIIIISEIEIIKNDLEVQKYESENPKTFFDLITIKSFEKNKIGYSNSEILFTLSKLNKLGLLNEYYDGSVLGLTDGGDYKTTDTFSELIKIIKV